MTMHPLSEPVGDRLDYQGRQPEPIERRPAIALQLASGRWFRAFRRRKPVASVAKVAHARLFAPGSEALEEARRKLRRLGVDAEPREVRIVVGGSPTV
jgi:hypothetical protein